MAPFSKPEAVLKQAEGLVSVGQSHAALQSLIELFSSKRFRSSPLASLEPIVLRFIELCVDMRRGRAAKEGLMQYKNIAQNTSVASIEIVIHKFIALADAKVTEAQEKAEKAVGVDVDDLEASETPESILLGAVSGDQSKDRTDRALVTPWLKFLWESYRTALETLKNNARLENIYQQIAQQAFRFCLKHQRKVEFRRLCETLRLHLSNVAKYSHQPHSINLSDGDTLQHHLDTRFAQLNTSVELELWQEAFRSVEDIHNLLNMAKKAPKPAMMANYYEKLTRIFLTSGNALFHAAAWAKYYSVVRTISTKSDEELGRIAGQVLISALAVPVGQASEEDEVKGRISRLTALLGLAKTPTRTGLLQEALSRNVLKLAPQPVKDLYAILEVTFDPLSLCSSVVVLLKQLSTDENYASYIPLLQRALLSRLLSQLAQVYETMEISQLLELVKPLQELNQPSEEGVKKVEPFGRSYVESFLIACARNGDLKLRINHREGSLTFVDEAFTSGSGASGSTSSMGGPGLIATLDREKRVQPTASEMVSTRLSGIAECLHHALIAIEASSVTEDALAAEKEKKEVEEKEKLKSLVAAADAERKALQVRRAIIARRRELISELSVRKEKEEVSRRAEASRREKDEAQRRAVEEMRKKTEERIRKDREEIDREEARKLAQELKEKNILKVDIDELGELNKDNLVQLQVKQIEKEKKDQTERLRIIAKRLDHTERAYRKEERPLLAKDYEQQQKDDRVAHEIFQKTLVEEAKRHHQEDLETKKRMQRILVDWKDRRDTLAKARGDAFVKMREEAQRKIEDEKRKRRDNVLKAREEERKRQEEQERLEREAEEERQRIEEERLEEIRRREEEEEAEARAAEEARLKKEEEIARIREERERQRKKDQEEAQARLKADEEREARRLARSAAPAASSPVGAAATAGGGGGAWRSRTAQAHTQGNTPPASSPATLSPAPSTAAAPGDGDGKYRPGALRGRGGTTGPGGGWRQREQEKGASGGGSPAPMSTRPSSSIFGGRDTPPRSASPAVGGDRSRQQSGGQQGEEEGFTTVQRDKTAVWKPKRGGRP